MKRHYIHPAPRTEGTADGLADNEIRHKVTIQQKVNGMHCH
jgi:hypothetical protein